MEYLSSFPFEVTKIKVRPHNVLPVDGSRRVALRASRLCSKGGPDVKCNILYLGFNGEKKGLI